MEKLGWTIVLVLIALAFAGGAITLLVASLVGMIVVPIGIAALMLTVGFPPDHAPIERVRLAVVTNLVLLGAVVLMIALLPDGPPEAVQTDAVTFERFAIIFGLIGVLIGGGLVLFVSLAPSASSGECLGARGGS